MLPFIPFYFFVTKAFFFKLRSFFGVFHHFTTHYYSLIDISIGILWKFFGEVYSFSFCSFQYFVALLLTWMWSKQQQIAKRKSKPQQKNWMDLDVSQKTCLSTKLLFSIAIFLISIDSLKIELQIHHVDLSFDIPMWIDNRARTKSKSNFYNKHTQNCERGTFNNKFIHFFHSVFI